MSDLRPFLRLSSAAYRYPGAFGSRASGSGATGSGAFALEDVSLDVFPGDCVAVLGPNGSGKTTLLRLLYRALRPSAGTLELEGRPLAGFPQRELARRVAVVPQDGAFAPSLAERVEDIVAMGRYAHDAPRVAHERVVVDALQRTDLWRLRRRAVASLSGGERRRVLLARALAQEPALILLDEPTTHLDLGHQADFIRLIEEIRCERSLTVLAVLHDLNLAAAWCPRALILAGGRVQAVGATAQVLTAELIRRVYGLPAVSGPDGGPFDFFTSTRVRPHRG